MPRLYFGKGGGVRVCESRSGRNTLDIGMPRASHPYIPMPSSALLNVSSRYSTRADRPERLLDKSAIDLDASSVLGVQYPAGLTIDFLCQGRQGAHQGRDRV